MSEFIDAVEEYFDRVNLIVDYYSIPVEQRKEREKEVRLQLDEWIRTSTAESKLQYLILLQRVKGVPSPWNAFTSPTPGEAPPASVLIRDQSFAKDMVEPGSLLEDAFKNVNQFFSDWSLEDYLLATGPAGWLTSIGVQVSENLRSQVKSTSETIGKVVSTGVWIAAAIGAIALVGGGVAAVVWMRKQGKEQRSVPRYASDDQLALPPKAEMSSAI